MERKIHILPVELTLKIAAGEVIERPASIVKELLENALDAGATAIRIDLQKGGCAGLRIEDNGCGIPKEEAPLAFERFATSKIDTFDDLYGVASFGFRGEALPSIAAVARVEMVTRTKENLSGVRIVAEPGLTLQISDAGCPIGTSIAVTHLFDNVPVRKKFLKSEATEQGYCLDIIHCAALATDQVRIDVTDTGRHLFSVPSTSHGQERLTLILGREAGGHLMPVTGSQGDGLRLSGYLSKPGWSRSSAKHLYCFVNRRHVKDPLIQHALMTAYRNTLEAKRYPVAVLHLEVPPGTVDVNVHPAKREVRFQNPREIYRLVVESSLHALSGHETEGEVKTVEIAAKSSSFVHTGAYQARVEEALKRYHLHTGEAKLSFKNSSPAPPAFSRQPALAFRNQSAATLEAVPEEKKIAFAELTFLGQAGDAFLVFAGLDGLVLVDQHAAHERILFEKLRHSATGEGMASQPSQQLLIPDVINLAAREAQIVMDYLPLLQEMGLDIELFGENSFVIKAIPAMTPDLNPAALIRDIIDDDAGREHSAYLHERKDRLMAVMACRGAVKAKHTLSSAEAAALCQAMDQTPFAATCPHGRPTYVPISVKELERMFKRK